MKFTIVDKNYDSFEVLIDNDDSWVLEYKWRIIKTKSNLFYVVRSEGQTTVRISREILNVSDPSILVDHWNHNTLDNRKENLRICSRTENNRNSNKKSLNNVRNTPTSKYKGVSKVVRTGRNGEIYTYWLSQIRINNTFKKKYFPLTDEGEIEAAKWYNLMATQLHGEFALLNEVE